MANVATQGPVRVVGGYDPLKDEYLLSVINDNIANVIADDADVPPELPSIEEFEGVIEDVIYQENLQGANDAAVDFLQGQLDDAIEEIEDLEGLNEDLVSENLGLETDLLNAATEYGTLQDELDAIDLNDITTTAENLTQYIQANGISFNEVEILKSSLLAEGSDFRTEFLRLLFDQDSSGSISTQDLVSFLAIWGQPVDGTSVPESLAYQLDADGELATDDDGNYIISQNFTEG